MRVAYLLTTPDSGAGTERTILTQAGLMSARHDVEVIGVYRSENKPHYWVNPRVKMTYLVDARKGRPEGRSRLVPSEWDNQFSHVTDRAIERHLRRTRADVIVTSTPALAALATEFAPRGTAIVHQEHRPPMHRHDGLGPLISHGSRLDLLTSLTQRSQDWLANRLGASAPPLAVVENPHEPGFVPRTSLSNRLIIGAGRFTFQKRFVDMVGAFAVANEFVPGWTLRIFGEGYDREAMRTAARRRGVIGNVQIVPPTRRLAAEMSKASIFALSSRYEGLPMVGIEAAVAGVPMVAYDIETGPAEIIGKAGGGLLAPNGSVEALGAAMATLMGDADELRSMSDKAREGARAFAPDVIARQWFDIFDAVAGGKGSVGVAGLVTAPATDAEPDLGPEAVDEEAQAEADAQPTSADMAALKAITSLPRFGGSADAQGALETSLAEGLAGAKIPYGRHTTDANRHDFVVAEEDRAAAMAIVHEIAERDGYELQAYRHAGVLGLEPWSRASDAPVTAQWASHVEIQRVSERPDVPAALSVVEFWAADERGVRFAPTRNPNAEWVDDEAWQRWVGSGSASVSGVPLWRDVSFPIDAVFTWVDGNDPEWNAKRKQYLPGADEPADEEFDEDATRAARFMNRDEIFFSVSAVKKFAPWVRNIFIVTDGQTPERVVQAFPDVNVVHHADIFPDPSVLPVFNSHAIETCLHRIPELSEHFLYFNDDVVLTRELQPSNFFHPNGIAKFFFSGVQINHGGHDDVPHLAAAANNRALIQRDFGVEITQSMLHTPYPHVKSVVAEMEERYPEEFARTRSSKFRSDVDISLMSSFAQYYGYVTQRYVPDRLRYEWISLRGAELVERMAKVLDDDDLQVIALGEPREQDWRHEEEHELVEEFLSRIVRPVE